MSHRLIYNKIINLRKKRKKTKQFKNKKNLKKQLEMMRMIMKKKSYSQLQMICRWITLMSSFLKMRELQFIRLISMFSRKEQSIGLKKDNVFSQQRIHQLEKLLQQNMQSLYHLNIKQKPSSHLQSKHYQIKSSEISN